MAVQNTLREQSQAGPWLAWVRKYAAKLGRPIFAVVLAVIIGAIVIVFTSPGSPGDRLATVVSAYSALWTGSFGSLASLSNTLVKVTPLTLASLSVAISFRAGLFNIGAAGQMIVGAMAADVLALKAPHWPGWLLIPAMLLVSMIAGGLWGAIVGFLKAWRGAHEVVTTIMLNWIAFNVTDYLINGPFAAPGGSEQTVALSPNAQLPQITTVYNQTLGQFLPRADPYQYLVDVGLLVALLALVVYWFISRRTAFGYEVRVLGSNPKAAIYAGIPTKRNILLVMTIAGAFAGLGGTLHLMGQFPYQLIATTSRIDPTGFDAIGASLLGMNTAVGALFGSLLFGGLRAASPMVQASGISGDIVLVLEALVLFCIASEFIPALKRVLPSWLRLTPLRAANSSAGGAPVAASNAALENAGEVAGQREKVAIDVAAREAADESAGGESTGAREE
ncbi:MAG TPA: ABC transporter permease [Ktedonobacteraceae bacterium]|nr:ABC transporter permease [Ktedonobacteraceae bacterium]